MACFAALCLFCAYRKRNYRYNRLALRRPSAPRPPLADHPGPIGPTLTVTLTLSLILTLSLSLTLTQP